MANPFYVKSARSGPALLGLADSIRDYKDRELINDELQRQEQFREDVMNYDPNQNQQISVEKNVLSDLGIDSISRLDDAAEFKEKIGGLPDDEIYDAVNERITMLTDQGRDASDTAQLLRMRPDDIREAVDTVEEIGFNERIRRMYANNPSGTVNFLNFMKSQQPDNLSDVTKAFDDETNMLLENARSRGATPEELQSLLDRREGMAKSSFGRFYDNYAGRSIRDRELVTSRPDRKYQKLGDTLYEETPGGLVEVARDNTQKMDDFLKEERKIANDDVKTLKKRAREIESSYGKASGLLDEIESGKGGRQTVSAAIMNIARLISPGVVTDADFKNLAGGQDFLQFAFQYIQDNENPEVQNLARYIDPNNPDNIDVGELRRIARSTTAAEAPVLLQQLDDLEGRLETGGVPEQQRKTILSGTKSIRDLDKFLGGEGESPQVYTAPNGRTFTDADIEETMRKHNVTREQVLQRLGL